MLKQTFFSFCVIFFAFSCIPCEASSSSSEAKITSCQEAIQTRLQDPESAKWEAFSFVERTGAVCGFVRAKNSLGEYRGFTRFICVFKDQGEVALLSEEEFRENFEVLWKVTRCLAPAH